MKEGSPWSSSPVRSTSWSRSAVSARKVLLMDPLLDNLQVGGSCPGLLEAVGPRCAYVLKGSSL